MGQLQRARERALDVARRAYAHVPAYRRFLADAGVMTPGADWDWFTSLPGTSKDLYLRRYPSSELMWPDAVVSTTMLCATSGSTGDPYYFPRSDQLARQSADIHARFLAQSSHGRGRTLVIVAFGMGVWIAGSITVRGFELASALADVPVAILPTGVSKPEILNALRILSPQFDQTILAGYPPFLREVLVEARDSGIDLPPLRLRLSFAAESFSDDFRRYVCEIAGITNPYRDTLNIYGSADIGAMAAETPASVLIRELTRQSSALRHDLFGDTLKTPTLAQFDPGHLLFEELDGELAITGDSALPLIRYRIGDRGGVRAYEDAEALLRRHGTDLADCLRRLDLPEPQPNPFVFVFERVDMSVSLYGMNLYPEYVKNGLHPLVDAGEVSGKFSMEINYDAEQRQLLRVHVEAAGAAIGVDGSAVHDHIVSRLVADSSEFRELAHQLGRDLVHVQVWDQDAPPHFTGGGKHRWVVRPRVPMSAEVAR